MKDCDEALANLYLYLDAELDSASSDEIRAHLDNCCQCGQVFDFEGRLKTVVKARLDEDVPETLINRVRAAIEEEACKPE